MPVDAAIARFWETWPELEPALLKAIAARDAAAYGDLPARISTLVEAIDPALRWELGPGETAAHCLTVSADADPELRLIAERWLARAPAPGADFEHAAARRPRPSFGIRIEGHDIQPEAMLVRTSVDEDHERLDVEVWHPAFPEMPENLRGNVTFLMLDGVLGEDGVERWVGAIDVLTSKPWGAKPLTSLAEEVDALKERATGDRWAVLRGEVDGKPVFASVNRAVKRIDHLFCTHRVEVVFTLRDVNEEGLPGKEELGELADLEDELHEALEALEEGVVFVGTFTRDGTRRLVFYARESSAAMPAFEAFAARVAWSTEVVVERDVRWEWLRRFG
ncbi:MAG: DUF695 domain-containing protein [Sandaracinus sp.]|nr:DUF695 domain-containing protein [Sandaracinus sp.]MCB9617945.1 DUF695 domain-containing protein [Sandaracinus sp.]MCB9635440.1 DUF695 domain-containing protein [Sandaracinus sp.]